MRKTPSSSRQRPSSVSRAWARAGLGRWVSSRPGQCKASTGHRDRYRVGFLTGRGSGHHRLLRLGGPIFFDAAARFSVRRFRPAAKICTDAQIEN